MAPVPSTSTGRSRHGASMGYPPGVFLAVLAAWIGCWVVRSDDRTDRVSRMLLAWRGDVGCLARNGAVPPSAPAAPPRCRLLLRRS